MRRISIGRSFAAMAAVGFLSIASPDRFVVAPYAPRISNEQRRKRSKFKKGPSPKGLTEQKYDKARLIVNRSSSFKKMRRWAKRSPDQIMQPTLAAKMRHPWFKKQQQQRAAA